MFKIVRFKAGGVRTRISRHMMFDSVGLVLAQNVKLIKLALGYMWDQTQGLCLSSTNTDVVGDSLVLG